MSKDNVELITCEDGDWEVLRLNGEVVADGHSIAPFEWRELITKLTGIEVEHREISNENMLDGNYDE